MNNPEHVKVGNKKYKINTDFRTAIECNAIATDNTIGDYERALAIIYKLFGDEGLNDKQNYEQLLKLAQKYLSCGKDLENTNEKPDMDYVQDYDYIKTSFRSDYGINLDKENMHWWEFFNLLNGLSNNEMGNCCILNRIRNLRNFNTSEIKDIRERNKIEKAKREVALKQKEIILNEKQQKSVDEFYKSLGY